MHVEQDLFQGGRRRVQLKQIRTGIQYFDTIKFSFTPLEAINKLINTNRKVFGFQSKETQLNAYMKISILLNRKPK